jgi:hypothetical protein
VVLLPAKIALVTIEGENALPVLAVKLVETVMAPDNDVLTVPPLNSPEGNVAPTETGQLNATDIGAGSNVAVTTAGAVRSIVKMEPTVIVHAAMTCVWRSASFR